MNICKNRQWLTVAAALVFGGLVLAAPKAAATGFNAGVALCLQSVLPALFPFFVVCEILTAAPLPGPLLRPAQKLLGFDTTTAVQALALGWVGGYAATAKLTGQLWQKGQITRRDAALLQLLGCCAGPGFVVGYLGGQLLGNVRLGVLLYALQLAANLLAAGVYLLVRPGGRAHDSAAERRRAQASNPTEGGTSGGALPRAITAAVASSLAVCGCVVFFRLAGAVLAAVLPVPPVLLSAFFEVSAGCADFAALGGARALYGCCAVLSLLGISVWAQMQLLCGAAFCPRALLISRGLHLVILQGLVRLCVRFLPGTAAACSSLAPRVVPLLRLPPDAAVLGVCFLCAALYKLRKNLYNK